MKNQKQNGQGDSALQEFYEVQYSGFRRGAPIGAKWHFAARAETLEDAREKLCEVRPEYRKRIIRIIKSVEVIE